MSKATSTPMTRHEFEQQLIAKAWKDESFKHELINDPKAVYQKESQQLGLPLVMPDSLQIKVVEETADTLYLVIPAKPVNTDVSEELSDEALEAVAGGLCFILCW